MASSVRFPVFLLALLFIFTGAGQIFGLNVKLIEKVDLLPGVEPLTRCVDFCMTDDGLLIVPDQQAGNIKIYERNKAGLEMIQVIGRKGFGSDEFVEPSYCFYNRDEGKLGVIDLGLRKVFVYDRISRLEFKRPLSFRNGIYCLYLGTDISLSEDKLLISGFKPDEEGNPFVLYFIDLKNEETNYLMPAHLKYDLNDLEEYIEEYRNKRDIKTIGIGARFDCRNDFVYFVWEGKLRIIRLDMKTRQIVAYNGQSKHYVAPFVTEQMLTSFSINDAVSFENEREKMSYIRDIYVGNEYIMVIFDVPVHLREEGNLRIQFYSFNGNLVKEMPIPGQVSARLTYDKERNILYTLSDSTIGKKKEARFHISAYRIQN